ncbi:hypothetical protein SCB71_15895 [Herbiconiux sp. KACC 21604]|uniref:MauE/DoxX family redox-associated membrane protein n=1 Tax=unclassified Herbiconiux TaxID=2618217 RepID=UPI001492E735|nr:MauE/DoxX family redox-associated membrane protein [Herbiconiux sp. SALV-R1]QJU54601.1 hypothetical protein HL652_13845 [Herbiconiux sp. SALV-R1]WPO85688.1 hypothetical protein SCB71_15895 [Herbiconiux sp. KACC 21604]
MTTAVGTALALVIAVTFAWSGVAKLRSPAATREALVAFGVPRSAVAWGAWAVPIVECAIAVLLLAAPGLVFVAAAVGAVGLLVVFSAAVLRVIRAGEAVHCNCFGAASAAPVTGATLARNGALVVVAAGALGLGGGAVVPALVVFSPAQWAAFFGTTTLVLAVVAVVAVVGRARGGRGSNPAQARRGAGVTASSGSGSGSGLGPTSGSAPGLASAGLAPGRDGAEWPVPDLEVTDPRGRAVELASIAAARPTLLVLLSADCAPCATIAARLDGWSEAVGASVGVAVLTSAEPQVFADRYPHLAAPVFYGARSLMRAGEIAGYPAALLLTPARTVAAGPAQGSEEVGELLRVIGRVIGVNTDELPVSHHEIAT